MSVPEYTRRAARSRNGARWPLAVVFLGVVRQWVYYGPWAALILAGCLILLLVPLRRIAAGGKRPGLVLDLLALFSAFTAVIAVSSVPFAHTPNRGTGVATSRHTSVGAAIFEGALTVVFWLSARWKVRRSGFHTRTDRPTDRITQIRTVA